MRAGDEKRENQIQEKYAICERLGKSVFVNCITLNSLANSRKIFSFS